MIQLQLLELHKAHSFIIHIYVYASFISMYVTYILYVYMS